MPDTPQLPARSTRPKRRSSTPSWWYLGLVALVFLATRLIAEDQWWSTLLLYAPPVVYALPWPLLALVALLRREPKAWIPLGLAVILIAGPLMGLVVPLPGRRTAAADAPRIRVLAYNIRAGERGVEKIADQVRRFNPDVMVLSEARPWARGGPLPRGLRALTSGWHNFGDGDVYIASRWPITSTSATWLGGSRERKKVRVTLSTPGGPVHVMGVHYWTHEKARTFFRSFPRIDRYGRETGDARLEQTEDVLKALSELKGPCILAGDFNNPPAGRAYGALTGKLRDSFAGAGAGWGYTYPSRLPVWRIDYIFHSPSLTATQVDVGGRPGSDHRPLFAELALTAPSR